jgi:hypothetical protein
MRMELTTKYYCGSRDLCPNEWSRMLDIARKYGWVPQKAEEGNENNDEEVEQSLYHYIDIPKEEATTISIALEKAFEAGEEGHLMEIAYFLRNNPVTLKYD